MTQHQVVKFAEKLYLDQNELGNKKYSLADIVKKIKEEFNKGVSRQTIYKWSKKFEWDETAKKIERKAIELAKQVTLNDEKEMIAEKAADLAKIYVNSIKLNERAADELLAKKKLSEKTLVNTFKATSAIVIKMNLSDKKEDDPEDSPITIPEIPGSENI